MNLLKNDQKISFINPWKVVGELYNPKGITNHS